MKSKLHADDLTLSVHAQTIISHKFSVTRKMEIEEENFIRQCDIKQVCVYNKFYSEF